MDASPLSQPNANSSAAGTPKALLALLMAMTAIGPLSLNILVPALPALASRFMAEPGLIQLTISLYLVGLAISQLVLGPLSDRFGRRPVVLAGLLFTGLSSAVAMLASSAGALIAARVAQSLSASAGIVIGRAIIRDLYDRERAASMIGWVATAMVVAPMISPLIGGILETTFGWEATFLFVAIVAFAVSVWAFVTLPETKPDHVLSAGFSHFWLDARALLGNANFNGYNLSAALGSATFFAFLGGGPHTVIGMMGRSSAEYGIWFVFTAFGYMMGNLVAARVSPRYGIERMIRAGFALQLFGAILSILASLTMPAGGPEIVFLPQWLISFGNGVFLPNAIAGAVSVRPQAAGTASGITGFAQFAFGAIAAQWMSHVLVSASTPLPMAFAMIVLSGAALVSFLMLVRPASRQPA